MPCKDRALRASAPSKEQHRSNVMPQLVPRLEGAPFLGGSAPQTPLWKIKYIHLYLIPMYILTFGVLLMWDSDQWRWQGSGQFCVIALFSLREERICNQRVFGDALQFVTHCSDGGVHRKLSDWDIFQRKSQVITVMAYGFSLKNHSTPRGD